MPHTTNPAPAPGPYQPIIPLSPPVEARQYLVSAWDFAARANIPGAFGTWTGEVAYHDETLQGTISAARDCFFLNPNLINATFQIELPDDFPYPLETITRKPNCYCYPQTTNNYPTDRPVFTSYTPIPLPSPLPLYTPIALHSPWLTLPSLLVMFSGEWQSNAPGGPYFSDKWKIRYLEIVPPDLSSYPELPNY
jgi:hypothetical protein